MTHGVRTTEMSAGHTLTLYADWLAVAIPVQLTHRTISLHEHS